MARAKRKRPPSRAQRWATAVEAAQTAKSDLEAAVEALNEARQGLDEIKQEFVQWKENLDGKFEGSPLVEKLEAMEQIDLDTEVEVPDCDWVEECESADLPLGFGRD